MKINTSKLMIAMARSCLDSYQISQKAGIARVTLIKIKRGERNPKPSTIGKIAKALDVDVTEIVDL